MKEHEKPHQNLSSREVLRQIDNPFARDIANQLGMIEQYAPHKWQSYFKSFCISKGVKVEIITQQLLRKAEDDKLEQLYDILIDATQRPANLNEAEYSENAETTVDAIKALAA
jgi:spore coat polysaccharide biosynthesis protein SpsF (cytidylyltransferase family)